jgi:hypothetical protein
MSTTGSAVRPRLKPFIQGEGGTTRLSPETAQWLREHLDEPTLRRWHEAHAGDIAGSADGFIARFRHVMEHSSFDFVDTSTASLNKKVF